MVINGTADPINPFRGGMVTLGTASFVPTEFGIADDVDDGEIVYLDIVTPALRRIGAKWAAGELDIATVDGELGSEIQRTPGLALRPTVIVSPFWIHFADQFDPRRRSATQHAYL